MRVYVATKFENKTGARELMRLLTRAGHVVTHDWTGKSAVTADEFRACALDDLDGVWSADVLVVENDPNMKGAWVEFGVALARLIPIVIVGGRHECIFEHLAAVVHVDSRLGAVAAVEQLRRPIEVDR